MNWCKINSKFLFYIPVFWLLIYGFCFAKKNRNNWNFEKYKGIPYLKDMQRCFEEYLDGEYQPHPFIGLTMDEVIRRQNYPVSKHKVYTEDGYILNVFRIPYSEKSPVQKNKVKRAVYLNHGLTANGHSFLIQWGNRNLALLLADSGFDVFLANARGSKYSSEHGNPNIRKKEYWDFSWHEMGVYDVPAIISMILNVTGEEKLYYVGHSMGTTQFMVAMSEKPELNSKIHTSFFLAPSAYLQHSKSLVRFFTPLAVAGKYLNKPIVGGKLETVQEILIKNDIKTPLLGRTCSNIFPVECSLCNNLYFMVAGYDGPQANFTEVPLLISLFPDQFSLKCLVHYAQSITTGKFRHFDYGPSKNMEVYGKSQPPDYRLDRITAKSILIYSEGDIECTPEDVEYTASKFIHGNAKLHKLKYKGFSHGDFATGKNAKEFVYDPLVEYIKENEAAM